MGNNQSSSSSSTPDRRTSRSPSDPVHTTVDGGFLDPQSHLYASALFEYSRPVVQKLILDRRLAPFFLGLNDFEPEWDFPRLVAALDEGELQATENIREALATATEAVVEAEANQLASPASTRKSKEGAITAAAAALHRERLADLIKSRERGGGGGLQWSSKVDQAKLYQGRAVECPICFLHYPPSLVHTRCCDQLICTECFVQIKRADPTATHLESEPAACPFCMELNFGCLYVQEKEEGRPSANALATTSSGSSGDVPVAPKPKARRKSFAHTEKQVVTTDQIHPDWESQLEAIRATAARRANRRIVFRQVGDRLIPVGITSGRSGDGANATMSTTALPPGFAAQVAAALDPTASGREGRRATRRRNEQMTQYLESIGMGVGPDLEEMMIQEAMRLSLAEDEERQKKEREEAAKLVASGRGLVAETSAQGAARETLEVPRTPATTATMLSEAIGAPIGSRPSFETSALSPPSLPTSSPTPSTSSASHLSSPLPSSTLHRRTPSGSISTLGALVGGSLATGVGSPSTRSAFPQQAEASEGISETRGIVGAGLSAATTPLRSTSSPSPPTSSPPQLPQLDLDTSSSLVPPSSLLPLPSLAPPLPTNRRSTTSHPETNEEDSEVEAVSVSSTAGYEPLEDDGASTYSPSSKAVVEETRSEGRSVEA